VREAGVFLVRRSDGGAVLGGAHRRRGVQGTPASSTLPSSPLREGEDGGVPLSWLSFNTRPSCSVRALSTWV
jgi:hypothetical protein